MKHLSLLFTLTITSLWAQIPDGYYNDASGLNGPALQQALHDIIDGHTVVSYSSLWTHYRTTDVKPNGKVWDMYSDIPDGTPPYEFTFVSDQCGNYAAEGDCYNREHSWPKSWFGDVAPMNTDIFHVVPSDGYVNGQRGNYPYGEVSSPTWTSQNGSKKGPNTYPGYSGTVFEPIDAYKGDFARAYFYMSTRYLNEDSSWLGSPMVNGAQLQEWALDMMMEWASADPVSQKEIDRNDDIYGIQHNRNPFVDHQEYADLIWGEQSLIPVAPGDLEAGEIYETMLELNWVDNADNEEGYYIFQDDSLLATLSMNSTHTWIYELEPDQPYTFSLIAFNAFGESSSASIDVTTLEVGGRFSSHFLEDFESMAGTTYGEGNVSMPSGVWYFFQAGNFDLGVPYRGESCVALKDFTSAAQIITPQVNTLGIISFYYYQVAGTPNNEFQIQESVNGGAFTTIATQNYNVGTTYTHFSLTVNDASDAIKIKILNANQTANLIIDDIRLTAFRPVSVEEETVQKADRLQLFPAFPNPFNPSVQLHFLVASEPQELSLQIFNLNGELIATPHQGFSPPGSYELVWDAVDQRGQALPSGVYFVRLSSPGESQLQRVTLLR